MAYYQKDLECMPREELRALQSERLCKQVKRCYEKVECFRKRMDEMGLKPEDIHGVEDLHKLPFSYKNDLRDYYPYGLFAEPLTNICRVHASSGTTGQPITGCYTKDHPGYHNGLHIHCVDGEVDYQLRNNVTFKTKNETLNYLRVEDHGVAEDRAVIDAIKAHDQSLIRSPYRDACKTLRLTLACNESIFTGQVIHL